MTKFAHDCMNKLAQVVEKLSESLGQGTEDLTLRIGMNSGEVTAGVLRGEKGRFQLFGDTVNTASRMESNGIPGRIQVSQSTADALILAGKAGWLTPREEKVVAKGLGEIQTYWIDRKTNSDKTPSMSLSTGSTVMMEESSELSPHLQGIAEEQAPALYHEPAVAITLSA
jgi:class 3 adenylate cyclase